MMADRGEHGEGQHDQRDVAVPVVPGAGLVVVETEFVLGRLEAVLDGPAAAFHGDEGLKRRAVRAVPCPRSGKDDWRWCRARSPLTARHSVISTSPVP